MESPLDPDDDFATYRVACPTCNTAVWAGHGPPPEEGEALLDGHDCFVPDETKAEPGSNGNEGVTMSDPGPAPEEVAAAPQPNVAVQLETEPPTEGRQPTPDVPTEEVGTQPV